MLGLPLNKRSIVIWKRKTGLLEVTLHGDGQAGKVLQHVHLHAGRHVIEPIVTSLLDMAE